MGAGHTVLSLRGMPRDDETEGYFRDFGIELPDASVSPPDPTPRKVRAALATLTDCTVTFTPTASSLDIEVDGTALGEWAVIWMNGYKGEASEDTPLALYFHRGADELVLRIVGALARRSGPFIVMLNNETPRLVTP